MAQVPQPGTQHHWLVVIPFIGWGLADTAALTGWASDLVNMMDWEDFCLKFLEGLEMECLEGNLNGCEWHCLWRTSSYSKPSLPPATASFAPRWKGCASHLRLIGACCSTSFRRVCVIDSEIQGVLRGALRLFLRYVAPYRPSKGLDRTVHIFPYPPGAPPISWVFLVIHPSIYN